MHMDRKEKIGNTSASFFLIFPFFRVSNFVLDISFLSLLLRFQICFLALPLLLLLLGKAQSVGPRSNLMSRKRRGEKEEISREKRFILYLLTSVCLKCLAVDVTSPHLRKKGKLFFLGVKLHHKQVSLIPSRVSISSTSENQLFFLFRECIFGGILGYFTLSTFQFDPPPEFVLLLHIFEIPAANLGRRIRETTLMGFSELLRLKTSGARQNAHRISIVAFSFPVFLRRKN